MNDESFLRYLIKLNIMYVCLYLPSIILSYNSFSYPQLLRPAWNKQNEIYFFFPALSLLVDFIPFLSGTESSHLIGFRLYIGQSGTQSFHIPEKVIKYKYVCITKLRQMKEKRKNRKMKKEVGRVMGKKRV